MKGQAIAVQADVTSREDMHNLASVAVDHFGQIDVMFNNADIT
jgi:NAD(P)-dependent dehydrogenase (short-subunit alcohol dehydrogenase family)